MRCVNDANYELVMGSLPCVVTNHPVYHNHPVYICIMLVQSRRRWAKVVKILYKCFVFVGLQR